MAILLVGVCCVALAAIAVVQFPALLDNPASVSVTDPSPTPLPVIEREPVASATAPPATDAPSTSQGPADEPPDVTQPDPTRAPAAGGQEASPLPLTTEQILLQAALPQRDQRQLAIRLKNGGQSIPETVETTPNYQIGDSETFWVTDNQSTPPRQFQVEATLQYITDHSYWWIENGLNANQAELEQSAQRFESITYPTNREFFGSEWSPGVDNDPRVHIFMGDVPGVAGYYSASNSYTKQAEPYSNEREMFFINLHAISPGNDRFDSVLAHEFQHMIHWYQDKNEDTWVNEGLSELASYINGFGPSSFTPAYTRVPDTQLNSWSSNSGDTLANYGGSFLFMAYFLQRYGEEMTKAVVASAENGIPGFDAVLADHNYPERFHDVFADFLAANYLQDPALDNGQWGYRDLPDYRLAITEQHASYPVEQQNTVYQFGADYIELAGSGDLTIEFTGSTRVPVVNNQAHSGSYQWYSHRGDDTNTRLTRSFDLSDVQAATLNFATWFDIESDWDYGYVEISTDGGQTWTILQTPHSATSNPSGNAYGPGYTGPSGGNEAEPTWLEESIDLTPYAGQPVQIRFEYVTDDAVNRSGWTIDDISIPEIGFFDDVEAGDNGWQAEGFVRIDNVLPQRFLVQIIEMGDNVSVRQIPLDDTNFGAFTVAGLGADLERAMLVISGLTQVTTQPASYQLKITQ
jgi:hypothetical protein